MKSLVNMSLLLNLIAPSLLTSHASATYNLLTVVARQESDLIDPVQQPNCSGCWEMGDSPRDFPGCPVVKSSCPNDENASENMKLEKTRLPKCGIMQYKRDCYCKLKTPISCAWTCNWEGWYVHVSHSQPLTPCSDLENKFNRKTDSTHENRWQTEDWFAQVCPDAPATKPVDYSGLPSCARQCLDDNLFRYGCLTQTSNCVCSRGDLFDCHKKCGHKVEWDQISRWLQDVCAISEAAATEALSAGTFSLYGSDTAEEGTDKSRPPPLPSRRPLRWDEIFVSSAAGLVGLTVLVLWVQKCVGRRRTKSKRKLESVFKGSA